MGELKTVMRWSAAVTVGMLLAACALDGEQTPASAGVSGEGEAVTIPNPEDFTTVGKPTKTIETPNGPVEVYDPTQDPEVRSAFKRVYHSERTHVRDIISFSPIPNLSSTQANTPQVNIVRKARLIHRLDLLRLGCVKMESVPCQINEPAHFLSACGLENLGKATLSVCESGSLQTGYDIVTGIGVRITPEIIEKKFVTEQEVKSGFYMKSGPQYCPFKGQTRTIEWRDYIGRISKIDYQTSLDLYLSFECRKWQNVSEN